MLNKEKYAKEILNIACEGHSIAMIDGKLRQCSGASCSKCDFNSNINCRKNVNEWANSEYIKPVEPPVDWSNVAVDTKVYVRDSDRGHWKPINFAKFEDVKIFTWTCGATSFSANDLNDVTRWNQGKLAEDTV